MRALALVWGWLALAMPAGAFAQGSARPDSLFPEPGRVSLMIGTGAPYVGLAEVGVGVTRHFAVGVIAAAAPRDRAIGLRPRFAIPLGERVRAVIATPFFYYPRMGHDARETWMLLRASAVIEGRFANGTRLHAGGSVLYADCTDMFFRRGRMNDDGFRGGVWNTFEIGGTFPITRRAEVFYEVGTVHRGLHRVRYGEWVGTTPFVLAVGLAIAFDRADAPDPR